MGGYLNPGEKLGHGVFTSADGKKSVEAYYEYSDQAAYGGNRDRVPVPGPEDRIIRKLDCRGEKRSDRIEPPEWLYGESTLREDDGETYSVTFLRGENFWSLKRITASEGDGR